MKQPITWYTLWKKLGKQPLYKTQHNRAKIKIDGEFYECAIVYDNNGSDFHLETMANLQIKKNEFSISTEKTENNNIGSHDS